MQKRSVTRPSAASLLTGIAEMSAPDAAASGSGRKSADVVSPPVPVQTGEPNSFDLRRLFIVYIAALFTLAACVTASMVVTEMQSAQLARDATLINQSGRQRMLSQRIVYLAQGLSGVDGAERLPFDNAFATTIGQFASVHSGLSGAADAETPLHALYFAEDDSGSSLDARIADFIVSAREVLVGGTDAGALDRLRQIERAGLLSDLDAVVDAYERASVDRIAFLSVLERYMLILAIAVVVLEVGFVFLPGHRAITGMVSALHRRHAELSDTKITLEQSLDALKDRNAAYREARLRGEEALEQSEAMRREQSEFTYAVSHDLKSPANTVHLILNELKLDYYDTFDDDGKELVDTALGTVQRMSGLVEDVLTYSWLTNADSEAETFDMGDCIADALADLGADIRNAGARIVCGPGVRVTGHRSQLRVLAQNLIANGIKFRATGTVPEIRISCHTSGAKGAWRLVVQDNGIGIPAEHQARIFGLFARLHVREAYAGTGLGLATCKRIVDRHRGLITVVSAPGAGSTFDVTLRAPRQGPAAGSETPGTGGAERYDNATRAAEAA